MRFYETVLHVSALTALACVACGGPQDMMTTYEAESGLFHMQVRSSWLTQEHPDGAGLMLASSPDALARVSRGQIPTGDDAALNITLMPPELLQVFFVELPPDASSEERAQTLLSLLGTMDGASLPASRQLATDTGQAWMVPAATNDGALVVLPLTEGTSVVATIVVGETTGPSLIDELTREMVGSFVLDGTRGALLEALDLPILFPFSE